MKIELLRWEESFAEDVSKHANNPKIEANLRDGFPIPYTQRDALGYIKSCMENEGKGQYCRAIVVDGEPAGSIGAFIKDNIYCKSAEIGYWLGESYWGKGIVTQAISRLCEEVFGAYDVVRIFAEPFARNIGSRRALEKAGFRLEGVLKNSVYKHGKIIDSCMYALLKQSV